MTEQSHDIEGAPIEACDVLVIGGGPGGAATAAFLAMAGLDVVVVEKARHPRFHIGESLLPHSLHVLDRLGLRERVAAIGVHKPGAEFVSEDGAKTVVFNFDRALFDGPPHAYQVRRSEFDAMLFERAGELGAELLQETRAEVVSCDDTGATVATVADDGRRRAFRAAFLVDASGRSTLTARMMDEKRPDPRNTSAAIYGHWRGMPRAEGPRGGNIRIYLNRPGWMWQIPLRDGITSCGLVAPGSDMANRGTDIESFFRSVSARNPAFAERLADAEPVAPLTATGNFSYRAARAYGPGHVRVGDAYGFLDPIFSTGVHLALTGAERASEAILACRRRPPARAALLGAYHRWVEDRLNYVSWFIYNIHNPAFRRLFLNPRNSLGIERAVISLLAGDLRRDPRLRSRIWLFKSICRLSGRATDTEALEHAG